ncbi:hypothetical protein [Candidatus Nitrotoga sp. HW29]|nr:hypothetical protein [Candidatus Nitrotoga sp. HW29]
MEYDGENVLRWEHNSTHVRRTSGQENYLRQTAWIETAAALETFSVSP